MIGLIQQAVVPHDRYQIELKLDYELFDSTQTHYRVETYIFVPRTLSITRGTYTKKQFYRDIQNYIRLKTPTLILRDFCESPHSPLYTVRRIIEQTGWVTDPNHVEPLIEQCKLLASTLKSAIREHIDHLRKHLELTSTEASYQLLIENLVTEFLVETEKISRDYQTLFAEFSLPNVDEHILAGYVFTDESISLLIEEGLIELWQIALPHLDNNHNEDLEEQFIRRVEAETVYRKGRGYPSILTEEGDNEDYQYRASVLKKYASSVLFLSTDLQREGRQLEHMAQALAAGIAMIFATAAAFYFQAEYGNFTAPFFAALVVGYMFKDRIKEVGRRLFLEQLHTYLYDRRIAIYTQDGHHKLGVLREKVSFIHEGDLPRRIREARNSDQLVQVDNESSGENVICYTKDIVLHAKSIREIFGETAKITGLNDIIRYDIRSLLTKMDDPIHSRLMLKEGKLQPVSVHKVYHVNLVTKYASKIPDKDKIYKRHRLVLNRTGIKRIEQVSV